MSRPLPKLVFIVGFPRSGTTWLMHLLARHPGVVGCHQAGLFHALKPLQHWWHNADGFGKELVDGDVDSGVRQIELTETLRSVPFEQIATGLATRVFGSIADSRSGIEVIVEQTPENLEHHELIRKLFPDAYFLHLVRDPRAVYCSWKKALRSWATYSHFVDSPAQVARKWCAFDAVGQEIAAMTTRYRLVRYEDLLRDPAAGLGELLGWLGLPGDTALCQRIAAACSIERMRKEVKAPDGFFRSGRADGWRGEIAGSALSIIEYLARDTMRRRGYVTVGRAVRRPLRLWVYERAAGLARLARFGMSEELRRRLKAMSNW